MIQMTHDNKKKFWFFYTKYDLYGENEDYELFAFTDDTEIVKSFKETRCMDKFYMKTVKLDRMNYNELIRHHMMNELLFWEGNCRIDSTNKVEKYKIAITKREEQRLLTDISLLLHEKLYHHVWDHIEILDDKYIDALALLGYPGLQTFVKFGKNPISQSIEDSLICNDINLLIDQIGWSLSMGKEKSD